ncbi:hypothetical protein FB446DRAFT_719801 [Lentinula raphanica]|nr:hypothetical protein EV360DRAFT_71642 [Lentinula raphanica]KAJ3776827.1 hypothetical protein FB446DRAFT_719801 [Lentinula raphanica]KAJ3825766.1 hypothetical protein F5880DRAFT_1549997 [Lentinula raphanica]
MTSKPTQRIALLSHPRTNSNMFTKLFESQPDIVQHTYPFMPGYMWGPDRRLGYKAKEVEEMYATLKTNYDGLSTQKSLDDLERAFGETEAQGKIPLTKEHVCFMIQPKVIARDLAEYSYPEYPLEPLVDRKLDIAADSTLSEEGDPNALPTNPTFVPDRFMNTLTPIFIIRNPMRMIPSWYKNTADHFGATTKDSEWPFTATFHWCRILYDYYENYFQAHPREGFPMLPIVVDGDDLVLHTEDIMTQLCDLIHLDSSAVKYTWEAGDPYSSWPAAAAPDDLKTPAVKKVIDAFGGNIARSTGVVRDAEKYAKPLVLEEEGKKWEKTWGKEVADDLVETVKKAMPDYEYMMKKRIRPRKA